MPFAAITYRGKPGHEEIAEIFAGFQRVSTPVLPDENGDEVGLLLGTAVSIKDDIVVRVIHYEGGDLRDVGRHMTGQRGVHLLEEKSAPYLAETRDTTRPHPWATIAGMKHCATRHAPNRLTSRIRATVCRATSLARWPVSSGTPALLTTASGFPTSSWQRLTESSSHTSSSAGHRHLSSHRRVSARAWPAGRPTDLARLHPRRRVPTPPAGSLVDDLPPRDADRADLH